MGTTRFFAALERQIPGENLHPGQREPHIKHGGGNAEGPVEDADQIMVSDPNPVGTKITGDWSTKGIKAATPPEDLIVIRDSLQLRCFHTYKSQRFQDGFHPFQ